MSLSRNLYTANQVRELDRIAIEEFGVSGLTLMQRAGRVTFEKIQHNYPKAKSITILCGPGNNGGDGYVIATLAIKAGLKTTLIQLGDKHAIKGDALLAKNAFVTVGGESLVFNSNLLKSIRLNTDVIVDAILGTGLKRNISDDWFALFNDVNLSTAIKVAVDIPSGLCSDTGRIMGKCIKADLTVTYIGLKCGLFTGQARNYVGQLEFDDLDVPVTAYEMLCMSSKTHLISNKSLISKHIIADTIKPRVRCSHKGHFGNVLLIGGGPGMSGAIQLAAEACLRSGAGLVQIGTHPSHASFLNISRPEMMVKGIDNLSDCDELLIKATTVILGPGLGKSKWAREIYSYFLKTNIPLIIDADALSVLSENPIKRENWILTPHPKEAARLLDTPVKEIESDRYSAVENMLQKYGGVIILKGAGSLVCSHVEKSGIKTVVSLSGNPGMSSGGMGDVLSGIIGALVAQDLGLFMSASIGVEIHAQAADLAAKEGEIGMLASDLFPHLRRLINNKTVIDRNLK